jgi:hypothetical protein
MTYYHELFQRDESSVDYVVHFKADMKLRLGPFHLERRESKPKAWVRINKDIEINPKADDSHPGTNEA